MATRSQNQDASASTRFTTCENNDVAPWVDLNNEILFLIMMQLGVVDFVAFGGVCKTWRSLVVSHRNEFMASRPPMEMHISKFSYNKEWYCCLEDFEGRKFKTLIPHSAGRRCVGLTSGYLILFGMGTNDLWLVNPITRHELHFPCLPFHDSPFPRTVMMAILVFSPSISGWVFIMVDICDCYNIWYSTESTRIWNRVYSTFRIIDLHAFKGKIYTLSVDYENLELVPHLCELRFNPQPKLMLLETRNFPKPNYARCGFVSWGENLCVLQLGAQKLHQLDLGEMKWVWQEKGIGEYAFFRSNYNYCAAIKPDSWASHLPTQYETYPVYSDTPTVGITKKTRFFFADMWYLPHDCLNVNLIDE